MIGGGKVARARGRAKGTWGLTNFEAKSKRWGPVLSLARTGFSWCFDGVILESLRRSSIAKRFLFGGEGPWPQPNPAHPEGEAPVVVHVPFGEKADWTLHIGLRYLASMFWYTPASIVAAFRDRVDQAPDDATFAKTMSESAYSKFLVPLDGGADDAPFAAIIADNPGATLRLIDFTAMDVVKPYDDMYVAGTLTLFRQKPDETWEVLGIALGDRVFEPKPAQRGAFDLAKLFVLQGAAYAMLFTEHPNLHFPFDSINAVTKTILPTDHIVHRVLSPHFRFQLPLNNAVLLSPQSVITNFKPTFYAPFTANMDAGLLELFVAGYAGKRGHNGYPPFDFALAPKLVESKYGAFGRAYYEEAFFPFAKKIADRVKASQNADETIQTEARAIQSWAHFLAPMVPGFPNRDTILQSDNLAHALATILYTLSLGHALDHKCFSYDVSVEQKYLRVRLPPPASTGAAPADIGRATTWMDRYRARLAHKIFFEPHVITKLMTVDYDLGDDTLNPWISKFRMDLREVEGSLEGRGIPVFMTLDETPASIQY